MTADYTIEATPGQVVAIERDGFLVVNSPTMQAEPYFDGDEDGQFVPVPTTKPCPDCEGECPECGRWNNGDHDPETDPVCWYCDSVPCRTCKAKSTVPIVVEVVVPERECEDCDPASNGEDWCPICMRTVLRGHSKHHAHTFQATARDCWLPARTILRGSPEAVPVLLNDDRDPLDTAHIRYFTDADEFIYYPSGWWHDLGIKSIDVTHHFADVPRPEVGDECWVVMP